MPYMGRRFWIIFIVILIVGLMIFLFLVWRPWLKTEKTANLGLPAIIGTGQQPGEQQGKTQKEPEAGLEGVNLVIEQSKGLEFKPFFGEEGEKIKETFLEQFSALTNLPISAPESASGKKEQSAAIVPEATSTEIIISLTDDEFHFLYPDAFISSLIEAQDLFIKEYDPNYISLTKIENDSQVRFVEEKITASLFSAGMITKEEMEQFITTIRFTLPQLQLTELKNRKSSSLKEINLINACFFRPSSKGLFLTGLVEKLYNVFIPNAQAKVCGHCYRLPECYQIGVPMPIPGYNVFKAFCSCNGCYYGQGCLDFCTSEGGMSAIWDPMTGICGCG